MIFKVLSSLNHSMICLPNAAVQFEQGFGREGLNPLGSGMEHSCAKGYTGTTFQMCLHGAFLMWYVIFKMQY